MQKLLMCLFVAEAFLSCTVHGYTKRWMWSTDWNDPKNWDRQRVPCATDEIVLADGTIYLKKNASVPSLALPSSGEVILGENAEITFEEPAKGNTEPVKGCPGERIRFIGNQPKDWFDPLNWAFVENNNVAPWNNGTLFMDRIPCKSDVVTFPELQTDLSTIAKSVSKMEEYFKMIKYGTCIQVSEYDQRVVGETPKSTIKSNAFSISISKDVIVAEIIIGGQSLSKAQLSSYLQSDEGKKRITINSKASVAVSQQTCQNKAGCACGYGQMKDQICSKFVCPADCENRATPEGDCCSRCGAVVNMKIQPGFVLSSCQNELREFMKKTVYSEVISYMSPIEKDGAITSVQILMTDSKDGSNALKAAGVVQKDFLPKSKACSGYDITVISKYTDGSGGGTGKATGGDGNKSTIALAVVLTLVLLVLALGGGYLFYKRRRDTLDFKRQVLHDEMSIAGVHDLELADTEFNGDVFGIANGKGAAFENPMYEEVGKQGEPAVLPVSPAFESKQGVSDLYSKPQKSTKKDKKKKKKNSNTAFENPVYNQSDFTQTFDDTFDDPVPGDTGMVNPMYLDMFDEKKENFADLSEPPSFLDAFESDTDKSYNAVEKGTLGKGDEKVQITISGGEDVGKPGIPDESEA